MPSPFRVLATLGTTDRGSAGMEWHLPVCGLFLFHRAECFISEERDSLHKNHLGLSHERTRYVSMHSREFYFRKIVFSLQIVIDYFVCLAPQAKTMTLHRLTDSRDEYLGDAWLSG